ncbi:MAG: AAA family ATPase [Actinomycetota bacterium]
MGPCPSCGYDGPGDARFCASCGTRLGEGSGAPRKERKFATALFADFAGSTALGERQDPEIVHTLFDRAFVRLTREIERYGGVVEKFMGDGLLAVFGVPTAHEDDPERAVRAALDMQAVLAEMNRSLVSQGRAPLGMRIGIEAGQVLVDVERAGSSRDRMLTGDAVNTAARLETAARAGQILVGPAVFASTGSVIDYEELDPLRLKGKTELVPAWSALRVKARRGGERRPLGLESKLVGRDDHLNLLKQILHRVDSENRTALVTILGPAGVGKSRLVWELERYVEGLPEHVYWRKGRCLPYGGVSYSALADAVKLECEIKEDDAPEAVESKVAHVLEGLFGGTDLSKEILALVGSGAESSFSREHLFDAWRRFLEAMASRYPLVLVLEDLHWADEGLLDFVDYMADWAHGPVLLVTLARPELLETRTSWGGGKRNYSAVYLDPLSPQENEEMLDDLLAAALPDEMKLLVVQRSEGNPLYTEEIVRMLIERGVLVPSATGGWHLSGGVQRVDLPQSIHALISARLDSLPSEEKAILQDASVVGRIFWAGAVAALAGRDSPDVRTLLGRLRVKELIIQRDAAAFSGEAEFSFRHILIRDVAYRSLPKALRADKHVEVARWEEARAGERRQEMAEVIATHYGEALGYLEQLGETGPRRAEVERSAFVWALNAGDRARKLWQSKEAIRWYSTAVALGDAPGLPDEDLGQAWEGLAASSRGVRPYPDVGRLYEEALARYEKAGRTADVGRVHSELAAVAFEAGQDAEVGRHLEVAIARLEPMGDCRDLAAALNIHGWYLSRRGRYHDAEPPLRRAIDIAARCDAADTQTTAMHTLGLVLEYTNRWQEGLEVIRHSYELAKEIHDLEQILRGSNNLPVLLGFMAGRYAEAIEILDEGLELARRYGNRHMEAWILTTLTDMSYDVGTVAEEERYASQALDAAQEVGSDPLIGMSMFSLALARVRKGEVDEGEALFAEARAIADLNPEPQLEVWMPVLEACVAASRGDVGRAADVLVAGVVRLGPTLEVAGGERLLAEAIRALVHAGRVSDAPPHLVRLRALVAERPPYEALARWAEGLVEPDPTARVRRLEDAASLMEGLGWCANRARCLIDLAAARRPAGQDPGPDLERARAILERCGAHVFLRELAAADLS